MTKSVKRKGMQKKMICGLTAMALLAGMLPGICPLDSVKAASTKNLVKNPGFENGTTNWTYYGISCGSHKNKIGTKSVQLKSGRIWQTIKITKSGYYLGSVKVNASGSGSVINIYSNNTLLQSQKIGINNLGFRNIRIEPVYLEKGTNVKLEAIGGGSLSYVDNFEFCYIGDVVCDENNTLTDCLDGKNNLAKNPGFENGKQNWYCSTKAKLKSNNPYKGSKQVSLEAGYVWQTVKVEKSGYYIASAYFSTGAKGAKLNIYNETTKDLMQSKEIEITRKYVQKISEPVYFEKGTIVKLEAVGNGGWSDVDNFEFYYLGTSCHEKYRKNHMSNNGTWEYTKNGVDVIPKQDINKDDEFSINYSKAGTGNASLKKTLTLEPNTRYILSATVLGQGSIISNPEIKFSVDANSSSKYLPLMLEDVPTITNLSAAETTKTLKFITGPDGKVVVNITYKGKANRATKLTLQNIRIEKDKDVILHQNKNVRFWIDTEYKLPVAKYNQYQLTYERIAGFEKNIGEAYELYADLTNHKPYGGAPLNMTVASDKFSRSCTGWAISNRNSVQMSDKYIISSICSVKASKKLGTNDTITNFAFLHEMSHCFDYVKNDWNFRSELMANFKAMYVLETQMKKNSSLKVCWNDTVYNNINQLKQFSMNEENGYTKALIPEVKKWKQYSDKTKYWKKHDNYISGTKNYYNCDNGIIVCLLNIKEKVGWNTYKAAFSALNYKNNNTINVKNAEGKFEALITTLQKKYNAKGNEVKAALADKNAGITGEEMYQFLYEYVKYQREKAR